MGRLWVSPWFQLSLSLLPGPLLQEQPLPLFPIQGQSCPVTAFPATLTEDSYNWEPKQTCPCLLLSTVLVTEVHAH